MRKHQSRNQGGVPQFPLTAEASTKQDRDAEKKPTQNRSNSGIPQFVSAKDADERRHPNETGWAGRISLRAQGIKGYSPCRIVVYVEKVESVVVNGVVHQCDEHGCRNQIQSKG